MRKVESKLKKQKELFIEQLKKTPIIQIVCERLDIGRTTYYRWKRQDVKFAEKCDKAMEEGCALINDIAESQLISAMKDNNLTAIMYWLNHRHETYSPKLEVNNKFDFKKDELTKEQEQNIMRALKLASLVINTKGDNHEKTKLQSKRSKKSDQKTIDAR